MKRKHYNLVIVLFLFLLLWCYIEFVDLLPKSLAIAIVLLKGEVIYIDSITFTTTGPIYRQIIGSDLWGNKRVVWVDKKIAKSANLNDGISQGEAIEIAKKSGINKIETIQLTYKPYIDDPGLVSPSVPEGVYWYIRGESISLFIDFFSGSIVTKYTK